MVLHTDQNHPHVHFVIKAMSERGERLSIRKATLREWRQEFARHLREHGVAANASERMVRGATTPRKLDGIFRPMHDSKRYSTHIQQRVESVAADLLNGTIRVEPGKVKLLKTREDVECGWRAVAHSLASVGQYELAKEVVRFVEQMPPTFAENEWLAAKLLKRSRNPDAKDKLLVR